MGPHFAERLAVQKGLLPEAGLILNEGERVFHFLKEEEKNLRKDMVLACFMHSPLPEAVILWLLKTRASVSVKQVREFSTFPMLDSLDAYLITFLDSELDIIVCKKFREEIESPAAENINLIRGLLRKK